MTIGITANYRGLDRQSSIARAAGLANLHHATRHERHLCRQERSNSKTCNDGSMVRVPLRISATAQIRLYSGRSLTRTQGPVIFEAARGSVQMARAPKISVQPEFGSDEQRSSGAMLVADRIARNLASSVRVVSKNPIVLVVDDDVKLRESLVRVLAECDLTAIGATSSLNALEILQQSHVDVVVSDHFAGGIDGVSLLSEVRQRWPHVQRILFTADAAPDIVVDAVNRAGVHKLLLKNMHAVQIRDEIEGVAIDALRLRLSVSRI